MSTPRRPRIGAGGVVFITMNRNLYVIYSEVVCVECPKGTSSVRPVVPKYHSLPLGYAVFVVERSRIARRCFLFVVYESLSVHVGCDVLELAMALVLHFGL